MEKYVKLKAICVKGTCTNHFAQNTHCTKGILQKRYVCKRIQQKQKALCITITFHKHHSAHKAHEASDSNTYYIYSMCIYECLYGMF